jgi:hypothetical protein
MGHPMGAKGAGEIASWASPPRSPMPSTTPYHTRTERFEFTALGLHSAGNVRPG